MSWKSTPAGLPPGSRLLGLFLVLVALVAGCVEQQPLPTGTVPSTPRPFTVVTTESIGQLDPAGVTTDMGATMASALFQRLMLVQPETDLLKPDAADDCLFRSPQLYECRVKQNLTFVNGNRLTSSDIKFSIERARRLAVAGSSTSLLSSLEAIETPDAYTVRFRLQWADTRFGYALATPAASIVDEAAYPAAGLRGDELLPLGSGPYRLSTQGSERAVFTQFTGYYGPTTARITPLVVQRLADSASVEEAMTDGTADVAWRGLDQPAVTRLQQQIDNRVERTTDTGWSRVSQPGRQVLRLMWNPHSQHRLNAALRGNVSKALQSERTLDSIVPRGVEGYVAAFPLGGRPTLAPGLPQGLTLKLSYPAGIAGAADAAALLRGRLETALRITVQVAPDDATADVRLSWTLPWIDTASGWLQPYLDNPLPGSASKLSELDQRARSATDANVRAVAVSEIQKQAAADNVVVPISQADGVMFTAEGVKVIDQGFGAGWQLALWGLEQ